MATPIRPAAVVYDWSRTHARRRGGDALERRAHGELPAASVVTRLFRDRRGEASVAGGLMERRDGDKTT